MPLKFIHILFVLTSLVVTVGFAYWGLHGPGAEAALPVRGPAISALLFSLGLAVYGALRFHKLIRLKGPGQ